MSWSPPASKAARYALGEILRDSADHILLLAATPHKGDPRNFTLLLQPLDRDAYADVMSIQEAMERRQAPFYLPRTKEAMLYFPERRSDRSWAAKPVFTERIPRTVGFSIDGPEFDLYDKVTRFVKHQSARAAVQGDDPRARAVGFLMSFYQRRLASSIRAMRRSLENRAKRLEDNLGRAQELACKTPPTILLDPDELEEAERERLEKVLEAITLAGNAEQIREEIGELQKLAGEAKSIEESGSEAKLARLKAIMRDEGFFDHPDQRLLLFTEFKGTFDYLMERLKAWGFRTICIHGGMRSGGRAHRRLDPKPWHHAAALSRSAGLVREEAGRRTPRQGRAVAGLATCIARGCGRSPEHRVRPRRSHRGSDQGAGGGRGGQE